MLQHSQLISSAAIYAPAPSMLKYLLRCGDGDGEPRLGTNSSARVQFQFASVCASSYIRGRKSPRQCNMCPTNCACATPARTRGRTMICANYTPGRCTLCSLQNSFTIEYEIIILTNPLIALRDNPQDISFSFFLKKVIMLLGLR